MNKTTSLLIAGTLLATTTAILAKPKTAKTPEIAVTTPVLSVEKALAEIEAVNVGQWTMDFNAAKVLAAEKKLPILINFTGSDWCGWCKLMEANVFTQPEWAAFANSNLLMVMIDFPQDKSLVPQKYVERNTDLQKKFGVQGFPTYVILDDDGETELGRLSAGQEKTPTSFIDELKGLFRERSAEKDKFLMTLTPEAKAEFKAINTKISQNKAAQKEIENEIEAASDRLDALMGTQSELEEQLRDFRIKLKGEETYAEYKKAKVAFEAQEQELIDWIATEPEHNDENTQKFQAMQNELQKLHTALQQY